MVGGVRTKFSVREEVEFVELVVEDVPVEVDDEPVLVETAPGPVVLVLLEVPEVRVIVPVQSLLTL
jgi:hypothetical protein